MQILLLKRMVYFFPVTGSLTSDWLLLRFNKVGSICLNHFGIENQNKFLKYSLTVDVCDEDIIFITFVCCSLIIRSFNHGFVNHLA